ncbi:alpha/beta hydrolase [Curvibacter sp. RS43]|uniref:Alpha/beta hydrolase n=1 Tax=Curvibacter microcysteis TaxID=3026419 RepID=A0ABT5MEQ0_9BURK|nr:MULTISPECIES: alpha/beta hydrolase [unclassified Curvibacter]MDD0809285.1 alpha/beta hydrolase [Curvibacter sp. RS43]MDD0814382.1 alpha/beta hydrolase [Curvibacter sp. HBC28]
MPNHAQFPAITRRPALLGLGALLLSGSARAQSPATAPAAPDAPTYAGAEPLGVAMEGWHYPYPVQTLAWEHEGRQLRMSYMDVRPTRPNGQTVLLMHGKNFGSDYWAGTMKALSDHGYRVIAPDQIGFGKSAKPEQRYSFALLADQTVRLLDHLQLPRVAVVANSMGGMAAVHLARRHAARVSALVLENPLGLENYVLSIPPQETDRLVQLEMAQTPASYRNFLKSYFPNWQPAFERLVEQFARVQQSAEYPRFARISALTYQMIYDGPITDELPRLTQPTLLAIGQKDRTVFGRRFAPPEAVKPLGNFPLLGRAAQKAIPGSELVEFDNAGHIPHLEVPEAFHAAVLKFLDSQK